MKTKVGVLYGGNSPEHDVSAMSGKAVLDNISQKIYEPWPLFIQKDGTFDFSLDELKSQGVVFMALHGTGGEDGTMQGFLETLGVKYTAPGVYSSAVAMDKLTTKEIWKQQGLPIIPHFIVKSLEECEDHELPFVLKPREQGSSVGISMVEKKEDISDAYNLAAELGDDVMLEKYIDGSEITVGFLGGKALPVIQIIPANEFYDYDAKYISDETKYLIPPKLPKEIIIKAQEIAVKACEALKIDSYSRVDLMVDGDKPLLMEVNTAPGLTSHSLLPKAAETNGISFSKLIDTMIQIALK